MSFGEELAPERRICPVHRVILSELRDSEIKKTYGLELIFFCPEQGCDYFAWSRGDSTIFEIVDFFLTHEFLRLYTLARTTKPSREDVSVIVQLFKNAVRLKILFHKQRQFADDSQ